LRFTPPRTFLPALELELKLELDVEPNDKCSPPQMDVKFFLNISSRFLSTDDGKAAQRLTILSYTNIDE
jgi:hypothetical protein